MISRSTRPAALCSRLARHWRPIFEKLEDRSVPSVTLGPLIALQTTPGFISTNAVAVDLTGDTFVAGTIQGTAKFGLNGTTLSSQFEDENGFLAKYSPSGAFLWGSILSSGNTAFLDNVEANGLAVDAQGNPYVVGILGINSNATITGSAFIEKFNGNTGTKTFFDVFQGAGDSVANAIVLDSSGNAYVTGSFTGSVTVGGSVSGVTAQGSQDLFEAEFSSNISPLSLHQIGGAGATFSGNGIAVDQEGDVYLTGKYENPSVSGLIYMAELNPAGTVLWGETFGGNGLDQGEGIVVNGLNEVYVVGTLAGSASFGGTVGTEASPGTSELFVLSLYPNDNGNPEWFQEIGDSSATAGGNGIAIDNANSALFVTGYDKTSISPHGLQDVLMAEYSSTGQIVENQRFVDSNGTAGGTAIAVNNAGKVAMVGYYAHQFSVGTADFPAGNTDSGENAFVAASKLPTPSSLVNNDYLGNGTADPTVYGLDPATGKYDFRIENPSTGSVFTFSNGVFGYGNATSIPVAGDFFDDGVASLAVWTPNNLGGMTFTAVSGLALTQKNYQSFSVNFGHVNDDPVAADFDGDGIDDFGVYGLNPNTGKYGFDILLSSEEFNASIPQGQQTFTNGIYGYGNATSIPVVGDFDGSGKAGFGVYNPSNAGSMFAFVDPSSNLPNSSFIRTIGPSLASTKDIPMSVQYDGDGIADLALYGPNPVNPGVNRFLVLTSSTNFNPSQAMYFDNDNDEGSYGYGNPSSIPVMADYDGSGNDDIALFNPGSNGQSQFVYQTSQTGPGRIVNFGSFTDIPLEAPSYFIAKKVRGY